MTEILAQGKFDRLVELVVQTELGIIPTYKIVNLTIEFRVQKFPDGAVDNRAFIKVYNLRSEVRALLNKRRIDIAVGPFTTVFLSAGHRRGGGARVIFRGVVIKGESSRVGPDWVTEFDAFTAHQQKTLAYCTAELTFGDTPAMTVADKLFEQLKFGKPAYSSEARQILVSARPVRFAASGRVDLAISRFLSRYSLVYTLGDNGPLIVRVEGAINPDVKTTEIPLVSPETGLIGTPKITDRGVELKTILNAELRIFHRFRLQSETTDESLGERDRQFTCTKLEHVGTNRGEDFFTQVTGIFYPRIPFEAAEAERPASFTTKPIVVGGR